MLKNQWNKESIYLYGLIFGGKRLEQLVIHKGAVKNIYQEAYTPVVYASMK